MALTPELRSAARRVARQSRIDQGVPEQIENPARLERIAALLDTPTEISPGPVPVRPPAGPGDPTTGTAA